MVPVSGTVWLHGFWVRLRRQFLPLAVDSIDLVGGPAAERRVRPVGIVVADPATDPGACLAARLEGVEEDALVFERSPQPLDEDVVHPAAAAVHRDADVGVPQRRREGELVNWLPWSVLKISGLP